MANPHSKSLPLYEKIILKRNTQRVFDIIIFFLLLSLLIHRLLSLSNVHGFSWLQTIAFLCESWFTFVWVLLITIKWNPVDYKTYPERLLKREVELPPVDIFVTTADPVLEPPIITVNTVVSLLAVDYPAEKLACYVSDDWCSPLTFYSLSEAVKFARIWVPFCKKYDVQVRAPFRFFLNDPPIESSGEFQKEWKTMKDEYEKLKGMIEEAERKTVPSRDLAGELAVFSHVDSRNHPTVIKILWENKERLSHELPHLIYISREKRLKHPHHYKAGAMNVLTRVSGILTNAPYMVNVDCDMFVNNPQVVQHALCVLLDPKVDEEVGFVQFPQFFYDGLKDDPFGNQLIISHEYINRGLNGLQGPSYSGTGCFHRRKVIYGHSPYGTGDIINIDDSEQELLQSFGFSNPFVDSATIAFKANLGNYQKGLSNHVEAANHVAGSGYEIGTIWGSKVGWIYGSKAEDMNTGLMIHTRGWRSIFVAPNPVAFLGCAPSTGPSSLTQQKRWIVGLLEVLFSKTSPLFGVMFGKLELRQCVAYHWVLTWGLRSVPEICYAVLPAYCLITNSHFFPTVQEPAVLIPISLFLVYNLQQMIQYYETGQSVRAWWNNQRMARVNTTCAWLFGFITVILKFLGLAETVFEVTKKETSSSSNNNEETGADSGRFTFDESPMFVPGTTILFIQIIALLIGMSRLRPGSSGAGDIGVVEAICSVWLVLFFWPFFKGMFGTGKFGIPLCTIYKSGALALLFMHLCQRSG